MKKETTTPQVATNLVSFIPSNGIFNQRRELLKNGKELQNANVYQGCITTMQSYS